MVKDKKWLKDEIFEKAWEVNKPDYWSAMEDASKLIDQLEEPKKVVIPQFVAGWISQAKEWGYSISDSMGLVGSYFDTDQYDKAMRWARYNQNIFARAWLDGYEIKKEKKYLVEDNHYALLCKFEGKVISTHKSENDDLPIECLEFAFTEKEIKDYDERYWPFAEPVGETP